MSSTISSKLAFTFSLIILFASSIAFGQQPVASPANEGGTAPINGATQSGVPVVSGESYFDSSNSNPCCDSGDDLGAGLFGRGLIKKSDHAFDSFISPMTNPIFFEDPRNVTEARAIFLQHKVPLAAGSGDVQVYAVQLRARLTENVSLIATKDGYIKSTNPLVEDGWADLSVGLKFNLIRNAAQQRLLSGGFTFEVPTGEADPLQGNGDGELNLFLTGGMQLGCKSHWLSASGFRLPMNTTDESQSFYWSNHVDYRVRRGVYLLSELNWYHWTKSGQDGPLPGVEGLDLINLGSPGVTGNDIVTGAAGVKFKPNGHNEIGVAFEFPLTERRDIIDNRLTVDWIIRY
jgi:hypothetical protein